jgi:hypothetical protein
VNRLLAALGTALLAGTLAPGVASGALGYPVPEHDPFYSVPANVAGLHDGQVIRSRAVVATSFEIPLPARAWQLLYRTEDFRGRPTATVTTVLVPRAPWRGTGARPLLSYQTAEDGVTGRCAPSYALRAGLLGEAGLEGLSNAYPETATIGLALSRGWAVSVPDYEGPQSTFLVAATEARGVLDGIRAARAFAPAGIAASAPIGLWGYSGGSLASLAAAQLQPAYAPELSLTALAVGGLGADIRASIDAFSGSAFGGAIAMGINGFLRGYPELQLLQYLNARGQQYVAQAAHDCINDAVLRHPFLRIDDVEAVPDALDAAPVAAMLRANSPLYIAGVPQVPVYAYQAVHDELAPTPPARALLHRFCAAGVAVQEVENPLGEHLTEVAAGVPGALQFLTVRFAGGAPVDTCAAIP